MRPDQLAVLSLADHHTLMQLAHWATALDVLFGDMPLRDVVAACQAEMLVRAETQAMVAWAASEEIRH